MSEHTRNGKTFAQDALGFLFCLVGGFFAVSIVLSMRGQEPRPGLISALTWPVVELDVLLGHAGALLFSAGLATLGTMLFLRSSQLHALRPLFALLACSLGVALLFGAIGTGDENAIGAWLPGLVPGFGGRALALVLGLALAWIGWTLLASEGAPRSSSGELMPRVGQSMRHDAAGVSPAEAALLGGEPRAQAPRLPRREAVPIRDETIRPHVPPKDAPVGESSATRLEVSGGSGPARADARGRAAAEPRPAPALSEVSVPGSFEAATTVSTPSWEGLSEEVQSKEILPEENLSAGDDTEQTEETDAPDLSVALSAEFETEVESEFEDELAPEELEEEEGGVELAAAEVSAAPRASWEQIGLFDEEEALEEEAPPVQPARAELTSSFDFGPPVASKPAHEPEPSEEDPFALASAPAGVSSAVPAAEPGDGDRWADDEGSAEEAEEADPEQDLAPEPPSARVAQQEFLPRPTPAPRPEPSAARGQEGDGWSKLVYEAGCAILEQKRVAVSMLERSFGIDFDQACRVLDELQQAGLIGPYMGGRTRDILLTREQWLPHAPAS